MSDMIAKRPADIATCAAHYLKNGDLDGVVSMFHPDCQIFFPPSEPPHKGLEGARRVFADLVPLRPILESTIISEVINGDTALLRADWTIKGADHSIIAQGQSTEVVKRLENGGWGYFIDCPNGPPDL